MLAYIRPSDVYFELSLFGFNINGRTLSKIFDGEIPNFLYDVSVILNNTLNHNDCFLFSVPTAFLHSSLQLILGHVDIIRVIAEEHLERCNYLVIEISF